MWSFYNFGKVRWTEGKCFSDPRESPQEKGPLGISLCMSSYRVRGKVVAIK